MNSKKNDEKISYANPPKVLTEKPSIKKYFKYLLFFGPGAIVASMTIGQAQLILGPQIGAWAGFSLLWLITISVGSYIIAYVGCRFTMLSGINVMDLFAYKTRGSWLNILFIIIMAIFIPIFTASIITSLGQSLAWVAGFGHYLIWGITFSFLAGGLVLAGRYKLLEITQVIFIAVLAIGAIVSIIAFSPDLGNILPNFLKVGVPPESFPNYPQWVINDYPGVAANPIPFVMLGYLGTVTFTIITLVGYLGWIKLKKWGIFRGCKDSEEYSIKLLNFFKRDKKINYLPEDEAEIKKSRLLLKPLLVDLSMAFIIVAFVSAAYMIGGAVHLQPEQKLPQDAKLIQDQVVIFTYLAEWLKPLFQICVIFALFGTIYAGFEAASRMLYETTKGISKKVKNLSYRRFTIFLMVYLLVLGIPISVLMLRGLSVILMLSITLMFIGVIGVIMYGLGVIYFSQTVLPEKYRLSKFALTASIISIIILMIPIFYLFFI